MYSESLTVCKSALAINLVILEYAFIKDLIDLVDSELRRGKSFLFQDWRRHSASMSKLQGKLIAHRSCHDTIDLFHA